MIKAEQKIRQSHGGFMIGDLVLVEDYYERAKDHNTGKASYVRYAYPRGRYYPGSSKGAEPRAGWVVGFTSLRPGEIEWLGPDEGWTYTASGSVPAVLVRFWAHLKPTAVPYDGLRGCREGDPEPYPPGGSVKERAEAKNAYDKFKDQYPRDEKGRFK